MNYSFVKQELILSGQRKKLNMSKAPAFPVISAEERLAKLAMPVGNKLPMVLDTDTYNEIDDQFALAYALRSSEKIELKAVTAAPFLPLMR